MGQERVPYSVTCQFEPKLELHPSPNSLDWRHLVLFGHPGYHSEAWLKRLAAAYNACRGVPTDSLEKLGSRISHPIADALGVLLELNTDVEESTDRLEETCRGLSAILRPEPPPDPIEELKAKARAEIEAEEAKRKASDAQAIAESAEVFRQIMDAIFAAFPALAGASLVSHQSFTKHSDMTEVEVTVPGHRPFGLKMTRVGGVPWQPVKTRPFSVRGPYGGDYCDDLGRALVLSEITS